MSKKISNPPPPPGRFKPPPPTSPPPRASDVHACDFEAQLERMTAERDEWREQAQRDSALAVANETLRKRVADLLALAKQYAAECGECGGSGQIYAGTERNDHGVLGVESVPIGEPCPDCIGIRSVIRKAEPRS